MLFFMILGEKEFKKPILDELGQNGTNIENWRRNMDQRVEALMMKISSNSWFLKILVSFNGFGLYLKKGRRKSFEHLGEFSEIDRLDL